MSTYHVIGHNKDPEGRVHTPDLMRAFIGGGIFSQENGRFHHTKEMDADVIILTLSGKAYGHFEIAGTSPRPFTISNEKQKRGRLTLKERQELQYYRAEQQKTLVNPVHAQVQNRMYESLCDLHGDDAVEFEEDWVDLRVNLPGETTFYEIKTNATAKKCIRHAIGQLFEYAMYPVGSRAHRLVVVGLAPTTPEDRDYLQNLREILNLNLHYAVVDKVTGHLGELE